jgi:hypothetical protein
MVRYGSDLVQVVVALGAVEMLSTLAISLAAKE